MTTNATNTLSQKERRVFPFLRLMRSNGWNLVRISGSHHIHVKSGKRCIPVVVHNRCVRRDVARAILKHAGVNVGLGPHAPEDAFGDDERQDLMIEPAEQPTLATNSTRHRHQDPAHQRRSTVEVSSRHAAALAPVVLVTEEDETVLRSREQGREKRVAHLEEQATRLRSRCEAAAAALAEAPDTTAFSRALESLENLRSILLRSFDDVGKSLAFAPGTSRVDAGAEEGGVDHASNIKSSATSCSSVEDAETLCRAAATCMSVDERTSLLFDVMFIHSLSSLEYAVEECEFGSEVQDLLIRACFTQLDTCVKKITATASAREGKTKTAAVASSSACHTSSSATNTNANGNTSTSTNAKLQEWKRSLTDFLCARYLESLHKCTKVISVESNRREPPKGYTTRAELEQMKKPNRVVSDEDYKKSRVGLVKGLHLLLDLFGVRGNSKLRLLGPGINCERDDEEAAEAEQTTSTTPTATATASQAELLQVAGPAKASKNKKKRQAQRAAEVAAAKEQVPAVAGVATSTSQQVPEAPAHKTLWTETEREEPPDLSFVQQLVCPETVLYYDFMGLPFAQRFSIAANQACEYLSIRFGPCFLDSLEITRFFTRLATFQLQYPIFEWMYLLDQVSRFPTPGEHDRMLQCTSCLSRRAKPDRADRESLQLRLSRGGGEAQAQAQASGQQHKGQAPFAWKDQWSPHVKMHVGDLACALVANLRTAVGMEDPREPNVHDLFAGAKTTWILENTAAATLRHVNGQRSSGGGAERIVESASASPPSSTAEDKAGDHDCISVALHHELPLIVGADLHAELKELGVPTSLADLTHAHLEELVAWSKAGNEMIEDSAGSQSSAEEEDAFSVSDSNSADLSGVEQDEDKKDGNGGSLLDKDQRAALPARYDSKSAEYDEKATAEAVRRGRAILNTYRYSPVNQEQIWIENCVLHTELAELNKVPTRELGLPIGIDVDKDSAVAEWVELISSLQHERTQENAKSTAACSSAGGDKTKAPQDMRAERRRGQLLESPTNLIKHHLRRTTNANGDSDSEAAVSPQLADVRVRLDIWRNEDSASTYRSAPAASNVCSFQKLMKGGSGRRHGLRLLRQHAEPMLRFCDEMLCRLSAYPYPVAWRGRGSGFGAQLRRVNLLLSMVLHGLNELHDEELFAGDLHLKVFEVVKMALRSAKLFLEKIDPEADRTRDDGCVMHNLLVTLAAAVCARFDERRSGRPIFAFLNGIFCTLLFAFETAGPGQQVLGDDSRVGGVAGDRKQLRGLQGKPQYNGAVVRLLGPMPADPNRWRVVLEDVAPGQALSVKSESLGAVAPDRFLFMMWWDVGKLLTGLTEEVGDFMTLDERDKHWDSHLLWRRRTHSPQEFRDFLTSGKIVKDQYFNPMRNYLFRILWRILVDATPIATKKLKQKHKNIVKAIQEAADVHPRGGTSPSTSSSVTTTNNSQQKTAKPGPKQTGKNITRKMPFEIPDSTTTSCNVKPEFFREYHRDTSTLREDLLQLHRLATVLQQDLHESALASFKDLPPSARIWEVTRKAMADARASAGLVPFNEQARLPTSTVQALQEELNRRDAEARNPNQQKRRLAQLLLDGENAGAEVGDSGPIDYVRSDADKALVRRAASDCLRELMASGGGHGRNAATTWALETGMRYCQLRDTFGKIVAKVKPIFGGHDYVALADARTAVSLTKQNAAVPVMNAICAQRLELEALCVGLGIKSFPVPMY